MRSGLRLATAMTIAALAGCDHGPSNAKREDYAASATAVAEVNGNVVTRESTSEELARLSDISERVDAVDQSYPRPKPPAGSPRTKAFRMLPAGSLVLADGRTVTLDGVTCSDQGYEYLSRFFLDANAALFVAETGSPIEGKIPADVWVEERTDSGTSLMFPVEGGISSGWCDAKASQTSPHNARFAALEAAFAEERNAYKASAP